MKTETYAAIYTYLTNKYPDLEGKDFHREAEASLELLQALCGRIFEYDTYTETHTVFAGRVFLAAKPVDEVLSAKVDGVDVDFKVNKPLGILYVDAPDGAEVEVTYRGGYQTLPSSIIIALADLTFFFMQLDPHIKEGRLGELTFAFTELPISVQQVVSAYKMLGV